MNAEGFHDALTLLSPDLIAEADKCRQRTKAPARWKPLAAMAACFLLVLGAGWFWRLAPGHSSAAPERGVSMAEAAPVENAASGSVREDAAADTAAPLWEAVTVPTPDLPRSAVNRSSQPVLTLLTREDDWTAYENSATQELDALAEAVDISRLSEEDLLLIYLPAQTARATDVVLTDKGLQVCLSEPVESTGNTIALWLPGEAVNSVTEISLVWAEE